MSWEALALVTEVLKDHHCRDENVRVIDRDILDVRLFTNLWPPGSIPNGHFLNDSAVRVF